MEPSVDLNHNEENLAVNDKRHIKQRTVETDIETAKLDEQFNDFVNPKVYFQVLLESKWSVLSCLIVSFVLGFIYVNSEPLVYKADALLQVKDDKQDLALTGLLPQQYVPENEKSMSTNFEVLRSELVLYPVVKKHGLDIKVEPIYFPLVGKAYAHLFSSKEGGLTPAFLGMNTYAWGGEKVEIGLFSVPESLLGQDFTLVSDYNTGFSLYLNDQFVMSGSVGEVVSEHFNKQLISISVDKLLASQDSRFSIRKINTISAVSQLREQFSVVERIKKSDVLLLSLKSSTVDESKQVLDDVIKSFIDQTVKEEVSSKDKSIEYLRKQLPVREKILEESEQKLSVFRSKNKTINLTSEANLILEQSIKNQSELDSLNKEFDFLRLHYTYSHPKVENLEKQIKTLNSRQASLRSNSVNLPHLQQQLIRLTRDVEVNTRLYTSLLELTQKFEISTSGSTSNIRILEKPYASHESVAPNKYITILIALILGVFGAIVVLFTKRFMKSGTVFSIKDVEKTGIQVYTNVPFENHKSQVEGCAQVLASQSPNSVCIESLRSLRTMLQVTMLGRSNILMITGPSSGVGKSFISANLSAVLAQSGKKVVLIDADMRRGFLHLIAKSETSDGLSEILQSDGLTHLPVLPTGVKNFHILKRGTPPDNPSELLSSTMFERLVFALKERYDYVIIDTPPILSVTDAAIIGRLAGASIFVVREGITQLGEISESINILKKSGVHVNGAILNGVKKTRFNYGYNYKYEYKTLS